MGSSLILHDPILYVRGAAILWGAAFLQGVQRMSVLDESGGVEVENTRFCMRVELVLFLV